MSLARDSLEELSAVVEEVRQLNPGLQAKLFLSRAAAGRAITEGKDDYVEDVVIQQGHRASFRHKLQIPPRAAVCFR